jgi:CubicO group peptidase (beta-lactamase class C family)
MVLSAGGRSVWRGQVRPLRDAVTLYLLIRRGEDGALAAFFRNPEFNLGRGNPYVVQLDGDALSLTSSRNPRDRFQAVWDSTTGLLQVTVPMIGRTLALSRRGRNSAPGFYPETPDSLPYQYRVPIGGGDGWETASLRQEGLDPAPIDSLVQWIRGTEYQGFHTPYIHSLLIARHGKLVLDEYFYGHDRDDVHDMRSASKTFAGVLVGLALEHRAKFTLDTPVYRLFPEYQPIGRLDERKKQMTVKDLLTMTSGLACDDNDEDTPGNEDVMQSQSDQPDWYHYTLDLPMASMPGGRNAVYCSAGINLLGGVLRNGAGVELPEFFQRAVAAPLEFGRYYINLMPTGPAYLGGGIHLRPRDQLKLGQLYLDGGRWHGRQVLPAQWVKASLEEHSMFAPDHHYGYGIHLIDVASGGKTWRIYEVGGNGGQFVLAIPPLDMVVGFTAGNYGDYGTWYKFMTELVPRYVIPAVEAAAPAPSAPPQPSPGRPPR